MIRTPNSLTPRKLQIALSDTASELSNSFGIFKPSDMVGIVGSLMCIVYWALVSAGTVMCLVEDWVSGEIRRLIYSSSFG